MAESKILNVGRNTHAGEAVHFTSNETYTATADGYVTIINGANQFGYLYIYSSNEAILGLLRPLGATSDANAAMSCYVRKGMIIKTSGPNFSDAYFTPLV